MSNTVNRLNGHLNATELMKRGDYEQALEAIQGTISNYGPHLLLLTDQAACLLMTNNFIEMDRVIAQTYKQLDSVKEILQPETLIKSMIMLGKLEEERGCIDSALGLFNQAIERSEEHLRLKVKAHAQRLRLMSPYTDVSTVNDFSYCFSHFDESADFQSEIEHAILIFEAWSTDCSTALNRFMASKNFRIHPQDPSLFYFDLLEIALQKNDFDFIEKLISKIPLPEFSNIYEEIIYRLASQPGNIISVQEIFDWSKKLSKGSLLRVLAIVFKLDLAGSLSVNYALNICNTLPMQDQNRQKSIFMKFTNSSIYFEVLQDRSEVKYNGKVIALNKDSLDSRLMTLLIQNESVIPMEKVLKYLYSSEFSEENWQKLRVAVHRLNKKLASVFSLGKIIVVKKTELAVSISVKENKALPV